MHKILCVEDSQETIHILENALAGHHLAFATTVSQALNILNNDHFSMMLLDVELPDGNGFEVLAVSAERLKNTPVIFLTGRRDFASKVSAFSLGADDFIEKPFDPKELKLRVDSKLRKMSANQQQGEESYKVGNLVCNPQEQRIYTDQAENKFIDLTSLEFRIFYLLSRTPNKIFSRAEILDRLWGNSYSVSERAVDVHISNLRKKLLKTNVGIEAVISSGYRIKVTDQQKAI